NLFYRLAQFILGGIPQLAFGDMHEEDSHTRLPRPWAVGRTVLLISFILLVYLVVDFLQLR
ncbi:MAG: hypothetical protein IIC51_05465, partial [Planctomycetes bacterium]|nr:hypothetical protein [Planctomycetota bacterium]